MAIQEYKLHHLGIDQPLNIEGKLEEVVPSNSVQPVVFLIDEFHEKLDEQGNGAKNERITQNIANETELVKKAGVKLIGAESHAASGLGFGERCNDSPRLADHFKNAGLDNMGIVVEGDAVEVTGIESPEIYKQMTDDTFDMDEADIGGYPLNYLRSYYYLAALFRNRRLENRSGNMVLNAGKDHIDHIVQLIKWGGADQLAGMPATYMRVASAYGR